MLTLRSITDLRMYQKFVKGMIKETKIKPSLTDELLSYRSTYAPLLVTPLSLSRKKFVWMCR